jgi:hypothetical protein
MLGKQPRLRGVEWLTLMEQPLRGVGVMMADPARMQTQRDPF